MKTNTIILNEASGKPAHTLHCRLLNREDKSKPVEVLIYDVIGKDWDGTGFDAKDFANQLKGLDETRELQLRVNSRGGIVDEGIAIYNRLREWKGKTVAIVDGSAASIASVLIMGAKEVRMPKSAEILIHEAHAVAYGHAEDMRELAERLDSASNRIAEIYAQKTGKRPDEMRAYMRKTTVFNGTQAKEIGLADVLTDETPLYNFSPEDIENFRVPTRDEGDKKPKPPAANSGENTMNKEQIIAAIKNLGGTVAENATVDQLINQLQTLIQVKAQQPAPSKDGEITAKDLLDIRNELAAEKKARETERKVRITAEIDKLIANNQLPGAQKDKFVARATADETILEEYREMPVVEPGAEPMAAVRIEEIGSDPRNVATAIKNCHKPMQAWQRGNLVNMRDIGAASVQRGQIINANLPKLIPLWNTNTIDTALKRDVILQVVIKDFARRTMPLRLFSTVFENVPLEGTNKVQVPFYDLDTTASRSWSAGTGYTKVGNTTTDNREITVGSGATDGDRLFQDMSFTSEEVARQPYLKTLELAQLKVDKLASDLVADVLSVITVANFGASAKISPAASFDSDDIADLVTACKLWPEMGRGLVLDTAYHVNCLKDPAFKSALAAASDLAIKEGRLFPRVMGFNYAENPTVPTNSENLVGFAVFQSAILVATAPVPPVQEVRNSGTTYSVVTDPTSGVAFEYRAFGDNTLDTAVNVVEVSYGWAKGNGNALKRITSA